MRNLLSQGRVACPQTTEKIGPLRLFGDKQPYLFALFALLSVSTAWAQRALTEIPNSDPEYQQNLLEPADGFEITLFASDPMINKPLAMSFDARGRLWVACTETYPHIKPGELPSDKVYRLEDTDGDGVADKRTVFVDNLLIPTAILAMPEGVYVGNSTDLMFYEDKDDNGVADNERVVLSGFGTEDTHHIVHTLRAGPAGRIHFNQSVYIHSYLETPHGIRELKAGGVWRLRPETMELDIYSRGLWNSWGLQFDKWGQSFQSDGAGFEGMSYSYPGAIFVQAVGYDRYMKGLNPGQPKFSGLEIVSSRLFPAEWQGLLISCDFRGNRISSFKPVDSQSGFLSIQQKDLVTSTHGAFRPIDLQFGPDGALYVADWYNPIIQHGEVDFRDERRDRTHGRIWRIAAKDQPSIDPPQLAGASVSQLLEQLKSPEAWTRTQARLLLKNRGEKEVMGELEQWVSRLDTSGPEIDRYRLEALWVSQSLSRPHRGLIDSLFGSKDFHARAAAVRVLEEHPERIDGSLGSLKRAMDDDHPRVRLEAIHALRKLGGKEAAKLVMGAHRPSMDEATDIALWNTVRVMESDWLPHAKSNPLFFGEDLDKLIYAIRSLNRSDALSPLVTLWRNSGIDESNIVEALVLLGELGDIDILKDVFSVSVDRSRKGLPGVAEVLDALQRSASERKQIPAVSPEQIGVLLGSEDDAIRIRAATLAGIWKVVDAVERLELIAANESTSEALGNAVVDGLARMQTSESERALAKLGGEGQPFAVRLRSVAGYARSDPKAAVPMVVSVLTAAKAGDDVRPLIRPYLARSIFANVLADALQGSTMNDEVATEALRLFGSVSFDVSDLQAAVQTAAGIEPVNQALDSAQMAAFLEYTNEHGSALRGEEVYRRKNLLCVTCHAIGGSGGSLGPDLTSIGASAPMDYIVDSLLQPQKKIKEGFHVVSVTKKDGSTLSGTLAKEDAQSLELRDMSDRRVLVSKSEIASQTISPVSLMPPGLTAPLRKDELADLVLFLSSIGKEGDFKVSPKRMVRTFRYLDDQDGSRAFADIMRHKPMEYSTTDDPRLEWLPGYALVNGELPLDEFPSLRRAGRKNYHYLRFEIDVKSPGLMGLRFNDAEEVFLWVGRREVKSLSEEFEVEVAAGIQTLTLAVSKHDRKNRSLSIELVDTENSTAQVQIINGK